jgi:tetratricopeptide (TPR) repeat protein
MLFHSAIRILLVSLILVLPCSAQFKRNEAADFAKAENHYRRGMEMADRFEKARSLDHAIGLYKKYLKNHPQGLNIQAAYHHMGQAEQNLGRIDEAEVIYRRLIQRYQRGNYVGLSALQLAWLAYTKEEWEVAADHFKIASTEVTKRELRDRAVTKRIECLLKTSRKDELLNALSSMMKMPEHQHRDWARFTLGYQYYQEEQFRNAIAVLKPLLQEKTNNTYRSQSMFYTGLASTELGENEHGEDYLHQVLKISPSSPGLTGEQRRQIAHNKALSQAALMGLYAKKEDHDEVLRLHNLGDFGARGKTEARRSMTAGEAFYHFKRYQEARTCYRRVDRAIPNTALAFEAAYRCLQCDYQLKQAAVPDRVDAFIELYASIYGSHPNIHMALLLKAETLYDLREFEKAAAAFNQIDSQTLGPSLRSALYYKRAWCLAEMGDHSGAARNFSDFIRSSPNDPRIHEALAKRAESYFFLGDLNSALQDHEAVLASELGPELTKFSLQGSARTLREQKKYKIMINRYRRLLSDFKDLPIDTTSNAHYWIGWGYFKQEQYQAAKPYLKKAQELMPEFYNEPAGNLLVLLTFSEADHEGMNEILKKLFQDFPGKFVPKNMLTWLGVQLFNAGNFSDSVRYLERVTNFENPTSVDLSVWRTLAKGQNELGQFESALASAKMVMELGQSPRWKADTLLDIAQSQLGLEQLDNAFHSSQEALALNQPGTHVAGLHLVMGKVSAQKGDHQTALRSLLKAAKMIPDDPYFAPEVLFLASQSARKIGKQEQAQEIESQLKRQFPDWSPKPSVNQD